MKNLILLTFIISVCYACTSEKKINYSVEIETIRGISLDIVKAWNEGDYEGFIKYMDENAILLPQNTASMKGFEAISKLYTESFKNMSFEVDASIDEVQVFGDYAYEIGIWKGSINPKDGSNPISFNNKTITIYKRLTDGSWKIYRWMYNSNEPPENLHIPDSPE